MISGRVLASSALVDYATGRTAYTRARVAMAHRTGTVVLAIPAAALVTAWGEVSDAGRAHLGELCGMTNCVVDELTAVTMMRVGEVLAHAPGRPASDPVAVAHTVFSARARDWAVMCSEAEGRSLRALNPTGELELEFLP